MRARSNARRLSGGASGFGRAAGAQLAAEGARVAIADIDVEGGRESVQLVEEGAAIADVDRAGGLTFHGPLTVTYSGAAGLTAPVLRQNLLRYRLLCLHSSSSRPAI